MGADLKALDETEEELQPGCVVQHHAHFFAPRAQGLRRAGDQRHVGFDQRGAKILRDNQGIGQTDPRQVITVFVGGVHAPGVLRPAGDQSGVLVAAGQMRGDRRTPRTRANDRKIEGALLGHEGNLQVFRKPGIFSPASIASKFSRALTSSNRLPETSTSAGAGRVL